MVLPISSSTTPLVGVTGVPSVHADVVEVPHNGNAHQGFPCLVHLGDGELFGMFRSASNHSRTVVGGINHGVILSVRSTDYGATWGAAQVVVDDQAQGDARDPNLAILTNGTWVCTFPMWSDVDTVAAWYTTSTDQGSTWSTPSQITPESPLGAYTATTAPVVEHGGTLLLPVTMAEAVGGPYSAFMLSSTNGMGGPWNQTLIGDATTDGRNYDEPFLRKLDDGSFLCFSRYGGSGVARYTSTDGVVWSSPTQKLASFSGRPGFIECGNGDIFIGLRGGGDDRNFLFSSSDVGQTWSPAVLVPPEPLRMGTYFGMAEVHPNVIGCLYSYEDALLDGTTLFRYVFNGAEAQRRGVQRVGSVPAGQRLM